MGVQQSRGWVHYAIHRPEPHIMLFRCAWRAAAGGERAGGRKGRASGSCARATACAPLAPPDAAYRAGWAA